MNSEDDYADEEDREYTAELRTLYYINYDGLYGIGLTFSLSDKIENYQKKLMESKKIDFLLHFSEKYCI